MIMFNLKKSKYNIKVIQHK